MSYYYNLKIKFKENHIEDQIMTYCLLYNANGFSEDIMDTSSSHRLMNVYFDTEPDKKLIEDLKQLNLTLDLKKEKDKDWTESWKQGIEPFQLTKKLWVVPSWCKAPAEAQKIVTLDPGMAFGTGTHETTQLVAEALDQIEVQGKSILDVGTGTGLLAIVASFMGASAIDVTDNDVSTHQVAKENFVNNSVDNVEFKEADLTLIKKQYDIVVANIIDGVLIDLQEDLIDKTKNYLILSGICKEREPVFAEAFDFSKFKILSINKKSEWLCYVCQKILD